MTDEPRREPAGEDVVRRLLAQARHTGPTPDDVAARIDAALAAEAPPTADPAPSDPAPADLDARRARRRRRLLPTVLAAAAAAVVAGVGLGTSGLLDGGDEATTGQGASESGAEQAPSESTPPSAPDTGDRDDGAGVPQERDRRGVAPDGFSTESGPGEPVVRDGPTLVADLSAALASDRASLDRPTRRCAPASLPGQRVGVRLDDARAELVAAPAADGERRVDVYTCAGDRRSPAVSATVPAG